MDELSPTGGGEGYGAWGDAVDVGDDEKIADFGLVSHRQKPPWEKVWSVKRGTRYANSAS